MSRLDELRWLVDTLRASIEDADAEKRGPLANQYRLALSEIETIENQAGKASDPVDEVSARRSARRAGSSSDSRRSG